VAGSGLAVSALVDAPIVSFTALAVAAIGLYSATPPFWSLPTAFLRGDGAAAGIGLINSVGNLGGFVGPFVMGWMQSASGDVRAGLRVLAASAICSGLIALTVKAGTPSSQGPQSQSTLRA
jgi:ACS family tartrate transporter-like MFS transporter